MPPRRVPPTLSSQSSRVLSGQILDILLHLEREVVAIKKEQYLENEQNSSQQKVLSVQTRYYELVHFIQSVPGALIEIIIESLLQLYQHRYDQIDKGQFSYAELRLDILFQYILRSECVGSNKRCGGQGILRRSLPH